MKDDNGKVKMQPSRQMVSGNGHHRGRGIKDDSDRIALTFCLATSRAIRDIIFHGFSHGDPGHVLVAGSDRQGHMFRFLSQMR